VTTQRVSEKRPSENVRRAAGRLTGLAQSPSCGAISRLCYRNVVWHVVPPVSANFLGACGQDTEMDHTAESDARVMAASESDPRAFALIFERHYDAVFSYIGRRVGAAVADELASETFVAAFQSRQRYDTARPIARPWLLGIATNLLRHHYRTELRRLRALARLDRTEASTGGLDSADARLDAALIRPRLLLALAELSREERDALLLFVWADLSYDEIAQALRIPVGTVRSRLHRARLRMRELLGANGQYTTDAVREVIESDG
jgi:RNA polymerase sigma factor (sigma-70 family)